MLPGAAGRALGPEPREHFIAGDEFNPAAFQIVVAPIKRFPRKGDFVEEISHDILHQLITPASSVSRHRAICSSFVWTSGGKAPPQNVIGQF